MNIAIARQRIVEHVARLHVAEYSVLLMHSSEGRCYSTREMEQYLAEAGFRGAAYRDTAAARGVMTATK